MVAVKKTKKYKKNTKKYKKNTKKYKKNTKKAWSSMVAVKKTRKTEHMEALAATSVCVTGSCAPSWSKNRRSWWRYLKVRTLTAVLSKLFESRVNRRTIVKTPGGKLVYHYTKKLGTIQKKQKKHKKNTKKIQKNLPLSGFPHYGVVHNHFVMLLGGTMGSTGPSTGFACLILFALLV